MRQTIARNMLDSYTTIPQLTNFDDVDVTELERIRKESQKDYDAQGVKLTTMPFLVKAVAVGAAATIRSSTPRSSEEGDEIIYKEYVNIGIAVDTERGLVVPVLRDADRKNIPQIARELVEIADAARKRQRSRSKTSAAARSRSATSARSAAPTRRRSSTRPKWRSCSIGRSRMLPQWIDDAFAAAADDAAVDHLRPPHRRRRRGAAVPQRREGLPRESRPVAAGAVEFESADCLPGGGFNDATDAFVRRVIFLPLANEGVQA